MPARRQCSVSKPRRVRPWLEPLETRLAPASLPQPAHVVLVIEENHGFSSIIGSPAAPYINSLAQQGALMTNSFAIEHPSQPNYLDLFSGSNQGVTDDSFPHRFWGANLASELLAAGFSFRGYSQSMPGVGFTGPSTNAYSAAHNPWASFLSVPAADNMPFDGYFPADYSQLPTVSIVVPDVNNDMHNGSIQQGDAWLRNNIDRYAQWAKSNNSLLIVTWDEDDRSQGNHIATILVGAMVQPGGYGSPINHFNVLRTLEEMYQLPFLGASAGAVPIAGIWRNLAADENFVQSVYRDYLGRAGGPAEINSWAAAIPGLGRAGVVNGIARSPEALIRLMDNFYVTFLRRPADPGGEQAWVQVLQSGGTEEQVIAGLLSSGEFANVANNLIGSGDANVNFVEALYAVLLRRSPGNGDVNAWLNVLGQSGRATVAQDFVRSSEFRSSAVATFYGDPTLQPLPFQPFLPNLLHRPAPPAGGEIAAWVNTNLDLLDVEIALTLSQEYYDHAQGG